MDSLITPSSLQRNGMFLLRTSTVLLGFAMPISVALDNLLLAVVLFGLLFNLCYICSIATHNPVARAAWMLFFALFVAMFYGRASLHDAIGLLGKYADLAFVPMFMLMLHNDIWKRRAQHAFLGAMALTLLLSYLVGFKLLPAQHWMSAVTTPDNPAIFHSYITQNNMMAFAVFLALLQYRDTLTNRLRLGWGAFAGLAVANVLFMSQGRTGYLILLVLLCWFAWGTLARYFHQRGKSWGVPQALMLFMLTLLLAVMAYAVSTRLHDRVNTVVAELNAWQPNHENQSSSTGTRLNYYYNTIQIIEKNLLVGVGSGGFELAFTEQIQGTNLSTVANPHNEYLLITVQTGVIGLALLLYLFYTVWRCAPLLSTSLEQDAARGLVLAYMVNCTFNSALHDHSDGLYFSWMAAVLFAGLIRQSRTEFISCNQQ
jgi:O-antigen ligase